VQVFFILRINFLLLFSFERFVITVQPTDNHRIEGFFCLCVAIILLMACGTWSSLAHAESLGNSSVNDTPALVVPAEEASQENAPKVQTVAPEMPVDTTDTANDGGSLAGDFLSGYVAHSQGDVRSAIRYLKESLTKDPANQDLAGQLLVLQLMHGEMNDALLTARKLSKYANHELIVDLLLAVDEAKKGDFSQATAKLKQAQSTSFDHIWLPLLLGWIEPNKNALVPVHPSDLVGENAVPSFIYYHAALLNDYRGHHELAKSQYQLAIKELSHAPFRALLAFIKMRTREDDRETIQQLLIDLEQQRPEMAELIRHELPYLRSLAEAKELPKTSLVSTPQEGLAEVLLTMASMLYTLDTSQDIPLYLQLGLYLKPNFPTAQLMLGNYYESASLWQEAIAQYQRVDPTSPLFLKAGIRRAYILEKQEKPTQAEALLDGLMVQFPNSLEVVTAKGDLLRNRSDFQSAISYYDKAIAMTPADKKAENWALYFARGACYERINQLEKSEIDLQKALELSPNQPEVLNYLGYMWLDADKNVDKAFEMIKTAYVAAPEQPHIVDSMGWAYLKTGKLNEATALFESAAEVLPNDPTINEHLGDAYWYSGRKLEARFQWQRALDYAEDAATKPLLEYKIKNGLEVYSYNTSEEDGKQKSKGQEINVLNENSAGNSDENAVQITPEDATRLSIENIEPSAPSPFPDDKNPPRK
jgi:tetratricopeptide (TPR) repeat protein